MKTDSKKRQILFKAPVAFEEYADAFIFSASAIPGIYLKARKILDRSIQQFDTSLKLEHPIKNDKFLYFLFVYEIGNFLVTQVCLRAACGNKNNSSEEDLRVDAEDFISTLKKCLLMLNRIGCSDEVLKSVIKDSMNSSNYIRYNVYGMREKIVSSDKKNVIIKGVDIFDGLTWTTEQANGRILDFPLRQLIFKLRIILNVYQGKVRGDLKYLLDIYINCKKQFGENKISDPKKVRWAEQLTKALDGEFGQLGMGGSHSVILANLKSRHKTEFSKNYETYILNTYGVAFTSPNGSIKSGGLSEFSKKEVADNLLSFVKSQFKFIELNSSKRMKASEVDSLIISVSDTVNDWPFGVKKASK